MQFLAYAGRMSDVELTVTTSLMTVNTRRWPSRVREAAAFSGLPCECSCFACMRTNDAGLRTHSLRSTACGAVHDSLQELAPLVPRLCIRNSQTRLDVTSQTKLPPSSERAGKQSRRIRLFKTLRVDRYAVSRGSPPRRVAGSARLLFMPKASRLKTHRAAMNLGDTPSCSSNASRIVL